MDWDIGFSEDRQYGRVKSGGQVRDEHRKMEEMERDSYHKHGNGGGGRPYSQDFKYMRKRDNYEVIRAYLRGQTIAMRTPGRDTEYKPQMITS